MLDFLRHYLITLTTLASVLLHAAIVACSLLGDTIVKPVELAPVEGRASVALRASDPAQPRRVEQAQPPLPSASPRIPLSDEAEILVPEPLSAQPMIRPQPPSPDQKPVAKPAIERKPAKVKIEPTETVDKRIDEASTASRPSKANDGARLDQLPDALTTNPAPPYPADALAAGVEGTVTLRVKIDASGKVVAAGVYKSSNVASLDDSAVRTMRRWIFHPARRNGFAVPCEFTKDVEFTIRRGY